MGEFGLGKGAGEIFTANKDKSINPKSLELRKGGCYRLWFEGMEGRYPI